MADVTNDEANDLADDILGREEFLNSSEPGVFQRATDRVLEEIAEIVGRIFAAIFGGAGGPAGTGVAIVLLIAASALLGFAIYRAVKDRPPKKPVEERGARVIFDEVVEPEQLRADMERHAATGEWRLAVIAGFRLAIVGLIDAQVAREMSGATTGDFARSVAANRPTLLPAYDSAAQSFERAFYSDFGIDAADMDRVSSLLAQLQSLATEVSA